VSLVKGTVLCQQKKADGLRQQAPHQCVVVVAASVMCPLARCGETGTVVNLSVLTTRKTIMASIYDIPVQSISGEETTLAPYKGKVLLVVNVASKCGLTPQYEGLEKLYEDRRADGLVVLGFPANNFKEQEPGSDAEIQQFCSLTYNVQFPLFSKISVAGQDRH